MRREQAEAVAAGVALLGLCAAPLILAAAYTWRVVRA